jgi:hypothetical protein
MMTAEQYQKSWTCLQVRKVYRITGSVWVSVGDLPSQIGVHRIYSSARHG